MKCLVDTCKNEKQFKFPKDRGLRRKWLFAIRNPTHKLKSCHGLCLDHFTKNDFVNNDSTSLERYHLKTGVVPSVFPWSKKKVLSNRTDTVDLLTENNIRAHDVIASAISSHNEIIVDPGFDVQEEIVYSVHDVENQPSGKDVIFTTKEKESVVKQSTRSNFIKPRYDIDEFISDPTVILEFTGLENYEKFMLVFHSLGKRVFDLKCNEGGSINNLSLKNQLFLTLWKLRKNCTDKELSVHFNILKPAVGVIFKKWIILMSSQWSKINLWPSKQLTKYYMPHNFKQDFPNTRIIIDGTEIHVQRPRNPTLQQSTFSYYKNDTTLKAIVGTTPGGLFSFCSSLYGGSTSDRQIVERSGLQNKCDPNDLIMADRGFTIQDIFAPFNVTVAIPHFTRGRGYLPLNELLRDRRLSKYRVHVERIIGLLKTYKILSTKLNHNYLCIAEDITKVCFMLCNFKDSIMKNK